LCAEIAERRGKWQEAEDCYEMAVEDIEQHHARLHHDELRVDTRRTTRSCDCR
jgi:hypothetical protein